MAKASKWLISANLVALGVRVLLIVGASLLAGGDPIVALLGALGAEAPAAQAEHKL